MPHSTLTTPVANLTLTRTIHPDAIAIELRDASGHPLYAETIALTATAQEPDAPEQVR